MAGNFRVTFPGLYPPTSPGHRDPKARQGHYTDALNTQHAALVVLARTHTAVMFVNHERTTVAVDVDVEDVKEDTITGMVVTITKHSRGLRPKGVPEDMPETAPLAH